MHRSLVIVLIATALISGCATNTPSTPVYRGEYFYNFESAAFTPAGTSEQWCVDSSKLKDAELPYDGTPGGAWGTADIAVRGVLSPEGSYCNLGASKRFLDITEVVEITNRRRRTP